MRSSARGIDGRISDVAMGPAFVVLDFSGRHGSDHLGRPPDDDLPLVESSVRGHQAPGAHDAVSPDDRAVQDDAADSDERAVLNQAPMKDRHVPHADPVADDQVVPALRVEDARVLDVRFSSDADRGFVTTNDGLKTYR